ncbi:MAG: nucleotidyltransferase domain-containing protein [Armatimonadota bacterium]
MDAEEAIERVVETIRDGYDPDKIILFGSRVWGDPDADSDLDVLVIKNSDKRAVDRIREVLQLVHRFQQRPYSLPLDVLVKTPQEIEQRLAIGDDFIQEILTSGRVVYERRVV